MSTLMAVLLVIRVFDRSGQSAMDRTAAIREANAVLEEAGIEALWIDCSTGVPAGRHAVCTAPNLPGELIVRITDAPETSPAATVLPLGYSLIEPAAGAGTLATVFSDRVLWLSQASKSPATRVMGRAIAHEIGHLLIGTNEHSATGLMRALWTADDLARDRADDWRFTHTDRVRLHNSRIGQDEMMRAAEERDVNNPGS
jgi:hypothetical protein